jgi:hypothetical protein
MLPKKPPLMGMPSTRTSTRSAVSPTPVPPIEMEGINGKITAELSGFSWTPASPRKFSSIDPRAR